MTSSCTVSVVIVTFNSVGDIGCCLESLFESERDFSLDVVVVDNNSTDGTAAVVSDSFANVTLVQNTENVGFASACNQGADIAVGDLILLLNPDTEVEPHALGRSITILSADKSIGAIGGRTLHEDGSLNPRSCLGDISIWSCFCGASGLSSLFRESPFLNQEGIGGWDRKGVRDVATITGCYLMMSMKLWEQLGGLDASFFMYSEDQDVCWRVRQLGLKCRIDGSIQLVHHGGRSDVVPSSKMLKILVARAQLIDKHWPSWKRRIGVFSIDAYVWSRVCFYRVLAAFLMNSTGSREGLQKWRAVYEERHRWRTVRHV